MADEKPKTDEKPAEKGAVKPGVDATTMHVKVHAPYKIYFDGPAASVSAVNDTGPFDILLGHHNFMTLLNQGDVVIKSERGEERIPISKGVMHVKANEVVVFLDV